MILSELTSSVRMPHFLTERQSTQQRASETSVAPWRLTSLMWQLLAVNQFISNMPEEFFVFGVQHTKMAHFLEFITAWQEVSIRNSPISWRIIGMQIEPFVFSPESQWNCWHSSPWCLLNRDRTTYGQLKNYNNSTMVKGKTKQDGACLLHDHELISLFHSFWFPLQAIWPADDGVSWVLI